MRYLAYLIVYLVLQLLTYLITPLLACCWEVRKGWVDNRDHEEEGPRLWKWLSWFDTPDNSLDGDPAFLNRYLIYPRYLRHLSWLYRNSLYGFKWSVLAVPPGRVFRVGPDNLDYHTGTYGSTHLWNEAGAWQYKSVRPFLGRVLILNFGWLLEDASQTKALFMFSPRLKG